MRHVRSRPRHWLLMVLVIAPGCGSPTEPFAGSGTVTASINGVGWPGDHRRFRLVADYHPGAQPSLFIGASDNAGGVQSALDVSLCGASHTGVYALADAPSHAGWLQISPSGVGDGASA